MEDNKGPYESLPESKENVLNAHKSMKLKCGMIQGKQNYLSKYGKYLRSFQAFRCMLSQI